ncbi:MAG TPA: transketolase [Terriglobales bacterium]|nr:transketolase [Terriglobales bacterium]
MPNVAMTAVNVDELCVNTIRTLAIDAIQQANSGHPGTPMGMAPTVYALWQRVLRFDPEDPIWPNRDRFVLSAGHASMLLYSILHLVGTKAVDPDYEVLGRPSVALDDIRNFRQFRSRAAGHPEYRWTSGVETTTGPLGQGVATSVGMAIAGKWLAARYNRPGFDIFNYTIYSLCGDGCMMEGVSSEAASLAGHLKLNNLCWIYDNNHITIEGPTSVAFTEDVGARFAAYGWNVLKVGDANNVAVIEGVLRAAGTTKDRPTLIIVESHIGYGSPNRQDTSAVHGEPLGEEEIKLTKRAYGWPEDAKFLVPDDVYEHFRQGIGKRGRELRQNWESEFKEYEKAHPQLANEIHQMQRRDLPDDWEKSVPVFPTDAKGVAGRDSSAKVLNAVAQKIPWLIGGSADLSPSTKTRLTFEGAGDFQAGNYAGRNLHFGVREHAMGSILNGLALSKLRPFGSGFLIFSDYGRGAIRLSAIMEIPVTYIFTHDSIGVGEDGPTHQPIEHLVSLRAIPHLVVLRPGDPNETAEAWKVILRMKRQPVALILSRQALPTLDRTKYAPASGVANGAYVLADAAPGIPEVILMGTGSEVPLCVSVFEQLKAEGIRARVVSMPSWELFEHQTQEYRDSVLPPSVSSRVAVEQASTMGWARYTGTTGEICGMKTFGASAPLKVLQEEFGFTKDHVVAAAKAQLNKRS